jgi:hypothetical protein
MRLSEINDFINNQLEWLDIDDPTYLNRYSYGQNWDDIAIEELKRLDVNPSNPDGFTIHAPDTDLSSFTWRQLLVAIDNGLAKEEHGWAFEDLKRVKDGHYELQVGT